jgi:hypothetical protein
MAFEELFDGEEHWLGVDADPGWTVPFLVSGALVRAEGWKGDELETADPGLVVVEPPKSVAGFFAAEEGWSAFSVMLQEVARLLDVEADVSQEIARDSSWNVTGKWHRVRMGISFWDETEGDKELGGYKAPEGL